MLLVNKPDYAIYEAPYGKIYFGKIYRFMDICGISETLKSGKLRFKSAAELNDPIECNPELLNFGDFRFEDMSVNRKVNILLNHFLPMYLERNPKINKEKAETFIKFIYEASENYNSSFDEKLILDQGITAFSNLIKKRVKNDPNTLDEILNSFNQIKKGIKICSFSRFYKTHKSSLLWSHYADSQRGACLEFDYGNYMKNLLHFRDIERIKKHLRGEETPLVIDYVKRFSCFEFYNSDYDFIKWICTKYIDWKYENEVRLIKVTNDDKSYIDLEFPKELFTKIIFGFKSSSEDISTVLEIIKNSNNFQGITFEKMQYNSKNKLFSSKLN